MPIGRIGIFVFMFIIMRGHVYQMYARVPEWVSGEGFIGNYSLVGLVVHDSMQYKGFQVFTLDVMLHFSTTNLNI